MELNKQDDLKLFQVFRKNEADPSSLIFKIARTSQNTSDENPTSSCDEKSHSYKEKEKLSGSMCMFEEIGKLPSPKLEPNCSGNSEDIEILKEEALKRSLKVEISPISVKEEIKQEPNIPERRRSSRLLELQSKINLSEVSNQMTNINLEEKRPRSNRRYAPAPKQKKRRSKKPVAINKYKDPSQMKLKSILLLPSHSNVPAPSTANSASGNFLGIQTPKFANVDPSHVLSTLYLKGGISKPPVGPTAIFFNDKVPVVQLVKPAQDGICEKNSVCLYFRKTMKARAYLRRKYQMLDPVTLDNCYGNALKIKTSY